MTCENAWNASLYDDRHAFVYQHGADLIDLLKPQPGEKVLDLGCGTGHLTAKIRDAGAEVLGIDASAEMVEQARRNFPGVAFEVADARDYRAERPFDAVFSNAVLHWIKPPGAAAETIASVLKSGGRFVAEFGGRGNVRQIVTALGATIESHFGRVVGEVNPWYFPSVAEYATLLERAGLEVRYALLFDRPTPLEDGEAGMSNWLAMFGEPCLGELPEERRGEMIAQAIERMRPQLWREGRWTADYRRLRVVAVR